MVWLEFLIAAVYQIVCWPNVLLVSLLNKEEFYSPCLMYCIQLIL